MTTFSVIIATRNRPRLFSEALNSVLSQTYGSLELIVVNDGSDDACTPEYQEIIHSAARPIRSFSLMQRPNGHGQSYSLNFGVAHAQGDYVCFLDDDDSWTDPEYLTRVARRIAASPTAPDLHMSNQAAFRNDQRLPGPVWIESLTEALERAHKVPGTDGAYAVSVEELMALRGFCHINTLVVRRSLYDEIGGMDEGIRWECDHDMYLRLVDRAKTILYGPECVSRHNIPDPAKAASMTTSISELERRLYQLRVFQKAALFARHPLIRSEGRRHNAYTLKRITEVLVSQKDYRTACYFARAGLGALPTFRWAAYTGWIATRALLTRHSPHSMTQFTTRKDPIRG